MSDAQKTLFGQVKKERTYSERAVIDCRKSDWQKELHAQLYGGVEVDLIHFDYELDAESCELIAQAFGSEFQWDREPAAKAANFRKKAEWFKRPEAPGQA